MQVKKRQVKLDMEQWTGSKLGKEYIKAVYCHPPYLAYMQNESESHSVVSNSSQAPPSMGFSKQEWSGLLFPSPLCRVHHVKCWAG